MKGVSMVSPINESKKVKKYSTAGFKLYNRVAITITLAIFIYFLYLENTAKNIEWWFIFMSFPALLFYFIASVYLYNRYHHILFWNMDPVFSNWALDYLNPKYSRNLLNGGVNYKIEQLRVDFFLGNFKEAKAYIDSVNLKAYCTDLNFKWLTDYLFYDYLTRVHLGDAPNVSEYLEMLSSIKLDNKTKKLYVTKHVDFMKAINQIMVEKQPVDNMGDLLVAHNIDRLMFNYYSALNHLNQDQPEEAKTCFKEIANENPDLFYVKEAKKYLGEAV